MKHLIRLFTRSAVVVLVVLLMSGCASHFETGSCNFEVPALTNPGELKLERLDHVPRSAQSREAAVFGYFEALGCDQLERQALSYRNANNVICTIDGTLDDEILIAAHHDKLGSGHGVADNWSGIIILAALAEHYQHQRPLHTMRFVAFAAEEGSMRGARHYLRMLRKHQAAYPRVMLNIDTIGINDLNVDRRSEDELKCVAFAVAVNSGVALDQVRLGETTGDWEPFRRAGVATLNFHSLNRRSLSQIHSYQDRRKLIDDEKLQSSFVLIANTLSAIDHKIDETVSQQAFP